MQNVTPPVIPPGLPSELLEHRPDIAANERLMAGRERPDRSGEGRLFSDFQICSPSAGFESTTIVTWLSSPSAFAIVGASE